MNMFEKKKCQHCGSKLKDEWIFCPNCGEDTRDRRRSKTIVNPLIPAPLSSIFEDIDKEFERMDKMFAPQFSGMKIKPVKFQPIRVQPVKFGQGAHGGGISIVIQSGTGMKPRISVQTTGDFKKLEPGLKKKLGVRAAIEEPMEFLEEGPIMKSAMEPLKITVPTKTKPKISAAKSVKIKIPKVTEEPQTELHKDGGKHIIKINLPDVKSEDDIEVRKLEQSIEVKAFAGDKAYFKLLPIPADANVKKEFKNGVLTLEIS